MSQDEEFQEFLEIFQEESLERLVNISRALESLRSVTGAARPNLLDEVDRELHTVKGSARLLGFSDLASLVHQLESLARAYRDDPNLGLELLVEGNDILSDLVEEASAKGTDVTDRDLLERVREAVKSGLPTRRMPGVAPEPAPGLHLSPPHEQVSSSRRPAGGVKELPDRTTKIHQKDEAQVEDKETTRIVAAGARGDDEVVRVKASRLAELDEIVSDLTLARQRLETYETRLRTLVRGVEDGSADAPDVSQGLRRILHDFRTDALQVQNATTGLQRLAVDVRLRPVAHLFDHVPREVRGLERRLGKRVSVRIRGEETEMDRVILDSLKSPLTHLLRNAVDHGIERPDERTRNGKPAQGLLEVSAGQEGNRVVIRVEDDGAGIDSGKVREVAVTRGVLEPAAAEQMSDEDALQLIFVPGFSTRTKTSEISGRGVGMDAVRRCVEELKGDVRVHSVLGQGSEVTIRLPLTLLISRVMLVRSSGQRFALPTAAVEESIRLPKTSVAVFGGRPTVLWRGQTIPLVRLTTVLGQTELPDPENLRVLVVLHAGDRLALVVEELLEESSVVVKPLGWPLDVLDWVSGAVRTPSGEIALQVHVPKIFSMLRSRVELTQVQPQTNTQRSILVVDDSIVSRQMVGRAVEALGFDPLLAVDGMDAWGILERVLPQLIITDIEMPRLDGLGLARRVRADERLGGIPIVMVSNRGSVQDRQAGLEAGADGYLTKSEFNHAVLRDMVERMLA